MRIFLLLKITAQFPQIVSLSKANRLMHLREKWTSACDRILCLGQKQVNFEVLHAMDCPMALLGMLYSFDTNYQDRCSALYTQARIQKYLKEGLTWQQL